MCQPAATVVCLHSSFLRARRLHAVCRPCSGACPCCLLSPQLLPAGKSIHDIPKDTLEDACQLVKANSIQVGSRMRFKAAFLQNDGCTH